MGNQPPAAEPPTTAALVKRPRLAETARAGASPIAAARRIKPGATPRRLVAPLRAAAATCKAAATRRAALPRATVAARRRVAAAVAASPLTIANAASPGPAK